MIGIIFTIIIYVTCTDYLVYCEFKLQILHNNDMHARFDETDAYGAACPDDLKKQNKCYGGFARTKQAVKDLTEEAARNHIPSIFLNAGDTFQGTPYYTLFKWNISAQLFGALGFNASCLGNHEFDNGIDNVVEFLKHITTPVLACNINITSEKRLDLPNLKPSTVLTINGTLIGIIGYVTPLTKYMANTENLILLEEIPAIRSEAIRLKSMGINIIIALGHSGLEIDVKIATEVKEISLIVGGHSHSLLYTPKEKPPSVERAAENYPYIVTQKSGKKIPIVQAYAFTKYLGKLLVTFNENGDVITATGNTILLDSTIKKDEGVSQMVSSWIESSKERFALVKGYTRVFLKKSDFYEGEFESNLANLITDSMVDISVQNAKTKKLEQWTSAPISLFQNGGMRTQIDNSKKDGAITIEDLLILMPFQSKLCEITLRGSSIIKALEHSVSTYDPDKDSSDNRQKYFKFFLHFSGMRVIYNLQKPVNHRVSSVSVLCSNCSVPRFEPLQDNQIYTVITNSYLARGGDKFVMFEQEQISKTILDYNDTEVLISYVEKNRIIYPKLEGRIIMTGMTPNDKSHQSSIFLDKTLFLILFLFVAFVN